MDFPVVPADRDPAETAEIPLSTWIAALPAQRSSLTARLTSALDLEVSDKSIVAGSTAVVSGRVTNLTSDPVRVVLQVQGLPSSWCPPALVLMLPENNATEVFLHLSPPAGTAPGRYRWTLTAETVHRPMQAATAELAVRRPQPVRSAATVRRPRRRPWILPAVLCGVVAATVGAKFALTHGDHPRPPLLPALAEVAGRTAAQPAPGNGVPARVEIGGTIFVAGAQPVEPLRVSVARLSFDGISDPGHKATILKGAKNKVTIKGNNWTAKLLPGLYVLTFSKPGYTAESLMVNTFGSAAATLPVLQLTPVPAATTIPVPTPVPTPTASATPAVTAARAQALARVVVGAGDGLAGDGDEVE